MTDNTDKDINTDIENDAEKKEDTKVVMDVISADIPVSEPDEVQEERSGKSSAPKGVAMPLLVLNGTTLFPNVVMHMEVLKSDAVSALYAAAKGNKLIFVTGRNDEDDSKVYGIGVVAHVTELVRTPGMPARAVLEGMYKGRIVAEPSVDGDYPMVQVRRIAGKRVKISDEEREALLRAVKSVFSEYAAKVPKMPQQYINTVMNSKDPEQVFEMIASTLNTDIDKRQTLLEANNIIEKLTLLVSLISEETEIISLENEIQDKFRNHMEQSQREYLLREQLRTIENELGEGDNAEDDAENYKQRILDLHLAEESEEKLLKEANRLTITNYSSPEAAVIKNYLDTVLDLPWNKYTKEKADISKVRKQLDRDHYGMKRVKERVLETIAVKQLAPETKGQIICLYGPPGVGKTSVAKSIAKSLGRKYVRIALGGVRDESDIRGHRKTYIGAMPGRIASALIEAKSANPLILLDEIDKLTRDMRGDPSSALLEVLDSEQNVNFRDHYIEVPFDLSKVMFITTANDISVIDPPLRDRMEIIELSSYTREEKFHIAKEHLIPKQLKAHGMKASMMRITDKGIYHLIDFYTKEAGVRELERNIASLCRKAAKEIIESSADKGAEPAQKIKIDEKNIEKYLGHRKYIEDVVSKSDSVGVVNGLAWTSAGGVIMPLEVLINDGRGNVQATGSLGDVMQESSRLAVSFVRSIADEYGIEKTFYMDKDIHIHAPEGATPKDGPSAGVTMTTALVSALTGIPVRSDVAMTGEITLHGKVLPIGGLREKTMAAYKEGMKTVIIPKGNTSDLDEVDDEIKSKLNFVFAEKITDVLDVALTKKPGENKKETIRVGF